MTPFGETIMTPCEKRGYYVGDKFKVLIRDHPRIPYGTIIQLVEDDETIDPFFFCDKVMMPVSFHLRKLIKVNETDGSVVDGHPHAELMERYAKDAKETDRPWERWQCNHASYTEWVTLTDHPIWATDMEYRRKPITINGIEIPEPMKEEPEFGTEYWIIDLIKEELAMGPLVWSGDRFDKRGLQNRIIHAKHKDAETHAKALISYQ